MDLVFGTGFPADLPETTSGFLPFSQATFKPLYAITKAPDRGGRQQVAELGSQLWQMSFQTDQIDYVSALELQAWLEALGGGQRLFKAWHPHLRYPLNYRSGFAGLVRPAGGAFDGTCDIADVGDDLATITLQRLPNGFSLARGDMVSMPFEDTQILHRLVAPAVANGSGTIEISVTPTLPVSFSAPTDPVSAATFFKPYCLATVDADSIDGPFSGGRTGTVSFTAVQTF